MLELFESLFSTQVDAVFACLILLPVLIMLTMCVVYFLFDTIQQFGRRRPL